MPPLFICPLVTNPLYDHIVTINFFNLAPNSYMPVITQWRCCMSDGSIDIKNGDWVDSADYILFSRGLKQFLTT